MYMQCHLLTERCFSSYRFRQLRPLLAQPGGIPSSDPEVVVRSLDQIGCRVRHDVTGHLANRDVFHIELTAHVNEVLGDLGTAVRFRFLPGQGDAVAV